MATQMYRSQAEHDEHYASVIGTLQKAITTVQSARDAVKSLTLLRAQHPILTAPINKQVLVLYTDRKTELEQTTALKPQNQWVEERTINWADGAIGALTELSGKVEQWRAKDSSVF